MGRYILGRLGGLLIAFVLVSMITFLLMHAVPGGPPARNAKAGPWSWPRTLPHALTS